MKPLMNSIKIDVLPHPLSSLCHPPILVSGHPLGLLTDSPPVNPKPKGREGKATQGLQCA